MGIDSLIEWVGGWVGGKETDVTHVARLATFNKQQHLQFAVLRNLLIRLCVRMLTFLAYCISDSYSTIQTVYLDQPRDQQFNTSEMKRSSQSV